METKTLTVELKGERATYSEADLRALADRLMAKMGNDSPWERWEVEVADAGALLRVFYGPGGECSANVAL